MTNWNFTNGWSLKTVRVNCAIFIGLTMTLFNQPIYADADKANVVHGNLESLPSIEFLEYLGTGVTVDGEYLDPVNYTEIELDDKDNSAAATAAIKQTDKKQKDAE